MFAATAPHGEIIVDVEEQFFNPIINVARHRASKTTSVPEFLVIS